MINTAPKRLALSPVVSPSASAFDALVRAHYARLCTFAYRMVRSPAAAEDIVQDVFARIWERDLRLDYSDPLPYLYRAARNGALMYLRHERVTQRWQQTARAEAHRDVGGADERAHADELTRAIRTSIETLPERCELIFRMHREQDLSYAEIARVLGLSIKTVETQMGRALKSLRKSLAVFR